jgi:hypothetical protein
MHYKCFELITIIVDSSIHVFVHIFLHLISEKCRIKSIQLFVYFQTERAATGKITSTKFKFFVSEQNKIKYFKICILTSPIVTNHTPKNIGNSIRRSFVGKIYLSLLYRWYQFSYFSLICM